jgi:hypothetical protein
MSHVDERDLERELAAVFEHAAARAPLNTREWPGPVQTTGNAGRGLHRMAAATAASLLLVGGMVAVSLTSDGRQDVRSVATAQVEPLPTDPPPPTGTELSLAPIDATSELTETFGFLRTAPIRPGSLVAASYEGYPVVLYTTALLTGAELAEVRCGAIGPGGNGFCTPVNHAFGSHGLVEGAGGYVWFWLDVPPRTVYARAAVADRSFWERPVGNAAVFPASDDRNESFAPWPVVGDLGTPTDSSLPPPAPAATFPPGQTIPTSFGTSLSATIRECLDDAGVGDPFQTPDPASDPDNVWNQCLRNAAESLDSQLADPSTSRPPSTPTTTASCPDGAPQATYTISIDDTPMSVADKLDVTLSELDDANAGWPNYPPFIPGTPILVPC